jgi:hypothetical protein
VRFSVKSSTGVADPRDMKRGISCPRQRNKSPGAPSPRISCKAWWGQRTSCGFPYRKPHTLPWLGPRSRKSGVLRAFCEGWDTTNLDTDRRISHPLPRAQRMGHPPFRGASCRVKHQPRLNRELVSSQSSTGVADPPGHETGLSHEARGTHSIQQEIRRSAVRDLQFRSLAFVLRLKQLTLRVLGNRLENYLTILLRIHFSPNLGNRPVRCDKESIALVEFHIFEGHQRDTIGSGSLPF